MDNIEQIIKEEFDKEAEILNVLPADDLLTNKDYEAFQQEVERDLDKPGVEINYSHLLEEPQGKIRFKSVRRLFHPRSSK